MIRAATIMPLRFLLTRRRLRECGSISHSASSCFILLVHLVFLLAHDGHARLGREACFERLRTIQNNSYLPTRFLLTFPRNVS